MILNKAPLRIGTPEQRTYDSLDKAIEVVNQHNGVTDVYATLYNGTVDKVCWDFDVEEGEDDKYDSLDEALKDFRTLTERFDEEGYSQMSVFSGNGLHKYLKTVDAKLKNPRSAIREVQEKYQEELNLNTDEQIFGDVERIFRVPNTWHPRAKRFCIPLKQEEIYLDKEEIFELAQDQRFGVDAITEGEPYPILQHDSARSSVPSFKSGAQIEGNFNPAEVEPEGTVLPIYPCISNLLQNWDDLEKKGHGLGFRRRFLIIAHLKETGHNYQECIQILKKYLSNEEFHHCVYDEKQPRQVYKRDDLLFPSCNRLMTEIPCIHDPPENECEKKDSLYV